MSLQSLTPQGLLVQRQNPKGRTAEPHIPVWTNLLVGRVACQLTIAADEVNGPRPKCIYVSCTYPMLVHVSLAH